jgi:hypothetical protein
MLSRNPYIPLAGPNPQPNFLFCLAKLMDNCDDSRNVTSWDWQSTELNWCHFSIADTKKSLILDKRDILNPKIKMSFPNKFMIAVAVRKHSFFPLGIFHVFNSFVSNDWEKGIPWL